MNFRAPWEMLERNQSKSKAQFQPRDASENLMHAHERGCMQSVLGVCDAFAWGAAPRRARKGTSARRVLERAGTFRTPAPRAPERVSRDGGGHAVDVGDNDSLGVSAHNHESAQRESAHVRKQNLHWPRGGGSGHARVRDTKDKYLPFFCLLSGQGPLST